MKEPLKSLARWQIATDPACASTDNVTQSVSYPGLFFIDCTHPTGDVTRSKNVFYTREQVLEIHRLLMAGQVPIATDFVPARQVP